MLHPQRAESVRFEEPLRLPARTPRGSDLRRRKNVRHLLTWGSHARRPDLAVVLIDEDGEEAILSTMTGFLEPRLELPVALGVAVREFESWLTADTQAVRDVL